MVWLRFPEFVSGSVSVEGCCLMLGVALCSLLPVGVGEGGDGSRDPRTDLGWGCLRLCQGLAYSKQRWRYLWFGFLCVLWIARIWPFLLKSWILSQILWISHRIGSSQHSGWLPAPQHWGKAQNSLCAELTGLLLPGTGKLFHTKSSSGISLSCLFLPQNVNTSQLGGNTSQETGLGAFQCFGIVTLTWFLWSVFSGDSQVSG